MANLQYIGARYVPIIYKNPDDNSAEWKAGETYEALTIVLYNDDSYTSNKAVPATVGDPSSNPEFWTKTGNFNAALATLQNEVADVQNDINEVLDDVGSSIGNTVGLLFGDPTFVYNTVGWGYTMQAYCYNSDDDRYLVSFLNSTTEDVTLALVASDFHTVLSTQAFTSGTLGHANSACYNPRTRHYYIAGYSSYTPKNEVHEISAALSLIQTIPLSPIPIVTTDGIGKITYDYDNDVYYGMASSNVLYKYDNAFNVLDSYTLDLDNYNKPYTNSCTIQDMVYFKDKLYCVSIALDTRATGIVVLNPDGTVFTSLIFPYGSASSEVEAIFVNSDNLFVVCSNPNYTIYKINCQGESQYTAGLNFYGCYNIIADNTDLDTLIRDGLYECDSVECAQTLVNSPCTNSQFIMIVKCDKFAISQYIIPTTPVRLHGLMSRRKSVGSNFTAWAFNNGIVTDGSHLEDSISVCGRIGGNGTYIEFILPYQFDIRTASNITNVTVNSFNFNGWDVAGTHVIITQNEATMVFIENNDNRYRPLVQIQPTAAIANSGTPIYGRFKFDIDVTTIN